MKMVLMASLIFSAMSVQANGDSGGGSDVYSSEINPVAVISMDIVDCEAIAINKANINNTSGAVRGGNETAWKLATDLENLGYDVRIMKVRGGSDDSKNSLSLKVCE